MIRIYKSAGNVKGYSWAEYMDVKKNILNDIF